MSIAITQGIKISVQTRYLEDESEPKQDKFVFAYQITIANEGSDEAQLLTRHWLIQDATNHVDEVIGDGVIGQMPVLTPGNEFVYTSYCPLKTEWGIMKGSYGMVRPDGEQFEAVIAPFVLMPPHLLN
jgi:ApaG protein